ncbi:NAD(P)-binding protein [Amycolatopsis sp. 195334CR]|uniref:NAD(P)-binding protein n=1 Tax=Amycolatopsis sp. 195334CR TaxID=2814588 RepID=UPI001A8CBED4|nr:NAD(P)-binding protein [Amycolatopsis sp. 195334CR]MBN6040966.1 NAD-binding protein [Amycolatopsis sp. 195334CR]
MTARTLIIGFGAIGASAARLLLSSGIPAGEIVTIDRRPGALVEAANLGVRTVSGDATDRAALRQTGITEARHVIVAVQPDATAVFITMVARELCGPEALVVTAVTDRKHAGFLRGADQVVISSDTAGAALATGALGQRIAPAHRNGSGWLVQSRPVQSSEIGLFPRECDSGAVGVLRGGIRHLGADADVLRLTAGDRLLLVRRGVVPGTPPDPGTTAATPAPR